MCSMQFDLVDRQCTGCTRIFRVLTTSPQAWCSNDCQLVNESLAAKRNRKKSKIKKAITVAYRGQTLSLADVARQLGISYRLLYARYKRNGRV